jgi:hypothetical protein
LVYSLSQMVLILGWLWHSDHLMDAPTRSPNSWIPVVATHVYFVCGIVALVGGAFVAIGGTVMQLVGVYRNCLCAAGVRYVFGNRNKGVVHLATDTKMHRDSWLVCSEFAFTGIAGMAMVSVVGWYYQMRARNRIKRLVGKLF